MPTFVILSRISPEAFDDPKDFKDLAKAVSEKTKQQCPGVIWKDSFATLGRFDVVDIVEAADPKEVEKAAMLIRAYGHASTETLVATPWKEFLAALSLATGSICRCYKGPIPWRVHFSLLLCMQSPL